MLSPIWHDSRKCSYFCGSWLNIWRQIGWFLQAGCSTSYTIVPDADMIPGDSQSEKKTASVTGLFFGIFVKTCLLPVPGMAEQLETFLGEPEQVVPSISYQPYLLDFFDFFHMFHMFHTISTQLVMKRVTWLWAQKPLWHFSWFLQNILQTAASIN